MKKTNKRSYSKPKLDRVNLVIEEAVLTVCKNPEAVGRDQLGCRPATSACKSLFVGS